MSSEGRWAAKTRYPPFHAASLREAKLKREPSVREAKYIKECNLQGHRPVLYAVQIK